ncbi:MAG: c-type cytochrome [Candidatus Scalindua sp.]
MKSKIALFWGLCVFAYLISTGCSRKESAQLELENPFIDAVKKKDSGLNIVQAKGKKLYKQYCTICHGEEGRGDGFNAFNLNPRPADLIEVCKEREDGYIIKVVTGGTKAVGKSSLCPPYGRTIQKEDINAIISYIERKLHNE